MIRRPVHGEVRLGTTPQSAAVAVARYSADPNLWLPPPATPVGQDHRVGLSMATSVPSPIVIAIVSAGPMSCPRPGLLVRHIGWRAETANDAFPVLQGDLEVRHRTEPVLRLVGSCTPPLSVLGALTDQLVGRHLAMEVVQGFLEIVARRLVEPMAPGCDPRAGVPSWQPNAAGPGPSRT